jgi:hypothetical protein
MSANRHIFGDFGIPRWSAITATLGLVGTSSAAWSYFDGRHFHGGFVKPCSLDGVNPAYHPDIFGNPAFAKAVYGFVLGRDPCLAGGRQLSAL